jgi:hypothetical protein
VSVVSQTSTYRHSMDGGGGESEHLRSIDEASGHLTPHVGNNISETYPRRIGQGLNDESCILSSMLSSFMGLPNPAWVSLGNVVSHMADTPADEPGGDIANLTRASVHSKINYGR